MFVLFIQAYDVCMPPERHGRKCFDTSIQNDTDKLVWLLINTISFIFESIEHELIGAATSVRTSGFLYQPSLYKANSYPLISIVVRHRRLLCRLNRTSSHLPSSTFLDPHLLLLFHTSRKNICIWSLQAHHFWASGKQVGWNSWRVKFRVTVDRCLDVNVTSDLRCRPM